MVNKVIEEASGKVMEKWGKEVAVECQISSAWFQVQLYVAVELMADKLGKAVITGMLWLACLSVN